MRIIACDSGCCESTQILFILVELSWIYGLSLEPWNCFAMWYPCLAFFSLKKELESGLTLTKWIVPASFPGQKTAIAEMAFHTTNGKSGTLKSAVANSWACIIAEGVIERICSASQKKLKPTYHFLTSKYIPVYIAQIADLSGDDRSWSCWHFETLSLELIHLNINWFPIMEIQAKLNIYCSGMNS